ncbi:zinc finger protein OZF-like [Diaphorina citri]|jgi:Putative transcriptional repressor regulating G2/M transition|uniref:Zinc finger protein OZF-like n=1 Tax=Diaphorina citri TaxID=121845 RepID=A0A3Q0JDZ1_DIACI|nr:zinc finger protein OZF-like [Diaphorina citri]
MLICTCVFYFFFICSGRIVSNGFYFSFVISFRLSENKQTIGDIKVENAVYRIKSKDLLATSYVWDEERCRSCGLLSGSITQAYIHYLECKNRKNKLYECSLCNKTSGNKHDLLKHLRGKHKMKIKLSGHKTKCVCHYCNKTFDSKAKIQEHISGHMFDKRYQCDLCGYQIRRKEKLYLHIREIHLGKQSTKVSCSICSRTFARKALLQTHLAVHTVEKNFECYYCQKRYCQKTNLTKHIQNFHLKTVLERRRELLFLKKEFICDVCGKSYVRKGGLTEHHQREHQGKKPVCTICGKIVVEKRSLEIHMNAHAGLKPHCCELCGRSFTTYKYLKVHMFCHTGETPHVCHLCPKKFRQRSSYTLHYKTHHPGVIPPKLR